MKSFEIVERKVIMMGVEEHTWRLEAKDKDEAIKKMQDREKHQGDIDHVDVDYNIQSSEFMEYRVKELK